MNTTAQNYTNNPSFIATVEQLKYDSFKQQDALKGHTIYFLSRIPV